MRASLLLFVSFLIGCAPSAQKPNDPNQVPVGKATGSRFPPQATCETARGAPVDAETSEGARIVEICISGATQEHAIGITKTMRLGREKKLTAEALRSDLRALYDSGFFDRIEATAHAAGSGAVVLEVKVRERRTITGVSITGVKGLADASLRDDLPKRGATLNLAAVRRATEKLREAYAFEGWEEAKIEHVVVPDDKNGARLEIVVTEGARSKLGKVTFDGAKREREVALRKAIDMEEGAPVSEERLARAALLLNAFYYDAGFLQVRVGTPKRARATDGTTAVAFTITEGRVFKIGMIKMKNVDPATEKDVLGSLKVKPGDVFSRSKLVSDVATAKASMSLRGRVVTIEPETELDPKTGTVDLVLVVKDGS